jgi:hypothetical protein
MAEFVDTTASPHAEFLLGQDPSTEQMVALREAVFLLQTEVPFFLKNVARVVDEVLVSFDNDDGDVEAVVEEDKETASVQQAGAGNVVLEGGAPVVKGHANVLGVKIVNANMTLTLDKKAVKTEIRPSKPCVLRQAIAARNFTQRAREGVHAWSYGFTKIQQMRPEEITFQVARGFLDRAHVALEELAKEVSCARNQLLFSASSLEFPTVNDMGVFQPSLPKHVLVKFDISDADLQVNVFVLRQIDLGGAAMMFQRSPFRKKFPSKDNKTFVSHREKSGYHVGEEMEFDGHAYMVTEQYTGKYLVSTFRSVNSSLAAVYRECEFLLEKIAAHQTIFESCIAQQQRV